MGQTLMDIFMAECNGHEAFLWMRVGEDSTYKMSYIAFPDKVAGREAINYMDIALGQCQGYRKHNPHASRNYCILYQPNNTAKPFVTEDTSHQWVIALCDYHRDELLSIEVI